MSVAALDVQARAAGEALGVVVAEASADGGGPLSPAQILREVAAVAVRVADRLESGEHAAVATIGEALGVWP